MQKLILAAFAGALVVPTAAIADHAPNNPNNNSIGSVVNQAGPYRNHGQCQSALVRERNQRRQDVEDPAAYNQTQNARWECQQSGPGGTWQVHRVDH